MSLDPAVLWVLRLAGAALWLQASLHKLRDPAGFRAALGSQGGWPGWAVAPLARGVPAVEAGLGLALLVPATARPASAASVLLLAAYTGVLGLALARGRRGADCGCGGPSGEQPLEPALLGRNLVLMALFALAATLPAGARPLSVLDAPTVLAAATSLALLYSAAEQLLRNASLARLGRAPWADLESVAREEPA